MGQIEGQVEFNQFDLLSWLAKGDLLDLLYDYTDGAVPHTADEVKLVPGENGKVYLTYKKEF